MKRDLAFLAPVALFLLLAPALHLTPHVWFGLYDDKRIGQVAVLVLAALWSLASPSARETLGRGWAALPGTTRTALGVFFLLGLVSSLGAFLPRRGLQETALFLLLGLFTLAVAARVRRHGMRLATGLGLLFSLAAGLYVLTVLAAWSAMQLAGVGETGLLFLNFFNQRFLNQYQVLTLPLLVIPLLLESRLHPGLRAWIWFAAVGWWMILPATGAVGAMTALAAAFLLLLLLFGKRALPWFGLQLRAALGGLLFYGILFRWLAPPGTRGIAIDMAAKLDPAREALSDPTPRLELFARALEMVRENPWLGAGPQHFAHGPLTHGAHPHNAPLQILAEWGLPAALLLGGVLVWGLFVWLKRGDRAEEMAEIHVRVALTAALLAGGGYALISGVFVMPLAQTALAVVMGAALGLYGRKAEPVSAWPLALVGGVAAIVLVWSLFPEVTGLIEREIRYLNETHIGERMFPRFWNLGAI